jgi:Zn-dependent protease
MFTSRWRLFRLVGIPINVDLSWLVILALITWTLAINFRKEVPDLEEASYWLLGLGTALVFFLCIVLHELGHAVAARAGGIPIRGITLFLFGGVAEMEGEPPSAGKEFQMAIAGPVVTALLACVFWLLEDQGLQNQWPRELMLAFRYLAYINTWILIFNLIPAFPLDGGRVLRSILWAASGKLTKATRWAAMLGQAFAWFLIAYAVWLFFSRDLVGGLWLGLIGMFLNNAARASYQQVLIKQALQGEPVSRFMNTQPIVVPPTLDLRHWVEDYVYRFHRKVFPVASDGRLEGVITTQALSRIPREEWDRHTVTEVMTQDVQPFTISPQADALHALEKMQRTGSSRLVVMEGDRMVGIISLKDLLRFLNLKLELEGTEE